MKQNLLSVLCSRASESRKNSTFACASEDASEVQIRRTHNKDSSSFFLSSSVFTFHLAGRDSFAFI